MHWPIKAKAQKRWPGSAYPLVSRDPAISHADLAFAAGGGGIRERGSFFQGGAHELSLLLLHGVAESGSIAAIKVCQGRKVFSFSAGHIPAQISQICFQEKILFTAGGGHTVF